MTTRFPATTGRLAFRGARRFRSPSARAASTLVALVLAWAPATARADDETERLDSADVVLHGETGDGLPEAATRLQQALAALTAAEESASK